MTEKLVGPYQELERDLLDRSLEHYIAQKTQEIIFAVDENSDPRSIAALRMAEGVNFSLEAGQYRDLLK